MQQNCSSSSDGGRSADVNEDGQWDVLDVVTIANCVINGNCCGLGQQSNMDACSQCVLQAD